MRLLESFLDDVEGNGLAIPIQSIFRLPVSIINERVQKHRLILSVSDTSGSAFLREKRRTHFDVCEVSSMTGFVHQSGERNLAGSGEGVWRMRCL
jgi:hypothetical protein